MLSFKKRSSPLIERLQVCRNRALVSPLGRSLRRRGKLLTLLVLLSILAGHRLSSRYLARKSWTYHPIATIPRPCPLPEYELRSAATNEPQQSSNLSICLTTLTDEASKSWQTKLLGWRNFDGLLQLTWDNKQRYCDKHGYRWFDESALLDPSRPPSWSKTRAVQRLLREESCDWVFWLDADTVIMNSEQRIEDFLPMEGDVLLSADDFGGYNAGVWLVRNTPWTQEWLDQWWNMKSFVKPTGLAKSGDNDALKYLTAHMDDFDEHIKVPPRCTFNSFARFVPPHVYDQTVQRLDQDPWYLSNNDYHQGDFVAHVAGYDNKVDTIKLLLSMAK